MDEYLDKLHRDKSRYYRDNLTFIDRNLSLFSNKIMIKSISFCLEKGIYNANILIDVAKSLHKQSGEQTKEQETCPPPSTPHSSDMIPEKNDINVFNAIFQ